MTSAEQPPISCNHYDYLEIACMDGYRLEIQMDDQTIVGRAKTLRAKDGKEYLVVAIDEQQKCLPLTDISAIKVLSKNRRFDHHQFR